MSHTHTDLRYLFLSFFAFSSLCVAYTSEFIFHQQPCTLCLYQRYGMFALLGLAFIGWKLHWIRPFVWVAFCTCLAINTYHIGVEQKWWRHPDVCVQGIQGDKPSQTLSKEEKLALFQQHVYSKTTVRCDEIRWRFLTIPMTIWVEVMYLMMFYLFFAARRCPSMQACSQRK